MSEILSFPNQNEKIIVTKLINETFISGVDGDMITYPATIKQMMTPTGEMASVLIPFLLYSEKHVVPVDSINNHQVVTKYEAAKEMASSYIEWRNKFKAELSGLVLP